MRTLVGRGLSARGYDLALTVPAVAGVVLLVALLGWSVEHTAYDTWAGVMVGIVLVLVSVPVLAHLGRKEDDVRVARLLPWALGLKLVAALVRFAVAFAIYDGAADASTYHAAAELLQPLYRQGDFSGDLGSFVGTGFTTALTTVVYVFTGPTKLGGFLVFSWLGFWGLYLFYRAFCLACPEGDRWRYARLVFLLPSLLFWPSSIGKEAWMTLTLGLSAYGAARILRRKQGGFVLLVLGMLGTAAVRPHVSLIFVVSLGAAYLLRRSPSGGSLLAPVAKLTGVVVLAGVLTFALGQTKELFGIKDTFDADAVTFVLEKARSQTSGAGSQFNAPESTNLSPSAFPVALVSVLFRPFPWEAENPLSLIASVEGLMLLALLVHARHRLVGAVRSLLRTPYVVLVFCYSLLFVYGFSSFANFGVLTRQRVQLLPFLLVLLALPAFRREEEGWRSLLQAETADVPDGTPAPPSRSEAAAL